MPPSAVTAEAVAAAAVAADAAAAARDATGRKPADLARDAGHGDVAVRVESLLAPDPAP